MTRPTKRLDVLVVFFQLFFSRRFVILVVGAKNIDLNFFF